MSKVKVEGYDNLTRDTRSNAIVNTSVTEYQLYMPRSHSRKSPSDQIKSACREIHNLKQALREIKSLIKEIIK